MGCVLRAEEIVKVFPGVVALDNVSVSFEEGKVHCIVGENGAGKSTLVKILTGIYRPERGRVVIRGLDALEHPKVFERIAYVPQEIQLFEHMSVAENLLLPLVRGGRINSTLMGKSKLYKIAEPFLERFHIKESPETEVCNISPSSKQLLQIARALVMEDKEIVIFDEPTTSLTAEDANVLFELIHRLRKEGKVIIYISHKLDEVLSIGDEITVLRDGRKVGYARAGEVDKGWIVKSMSGREIDERVTFRPQRVGDVVLEVKDLTGPGFSNISFNLRRGEILGFYGLVGAGRSEIAQAIIGYRPLVGGEIRLNGRLVRPKNPYSAVREGLFYLPEERKQQGIFPSLSVRHNVSVALGRRILCGSVPFVSLARERSFAEELVRLYSVRTPSVETQIQFLSGGNQQKVIVGRSIFCQFRPSVIIFDEPTKGIDVMAKTEIHRIMRSLAEDEQIGVILISSELEELLRCCNRILTFYMGRVTGEFDPEKVEISEIVAAIIGASEKVA